MKMEKEMKYVAPEVETLEVAIEEGFAGSVNPGDGNVDAGGMEEGDICEEFTALTVADVEAKWNSLPSGRRLILFAPNGTDYNGGSWSELDGWKNLIHETNLYSGFNDFRYILRAIIGELTSKGMPARKAPAAPGKFRSNY